MMYKPPCKHLAICRDAGAFTWDSPEIICARCTQYQPEELGP